MRPSSKCHDAEGTGGGALILWPECFCHASLKPETLKYRGPADQTSIINNAMWPASGLTTRLAVIVWGLRFSGPEFPTCRVSWGTKG